MSQAILPLRKTRSDSNVEGRWKAIRRNWFDELNDAVKEFRKLDSPEARAAFADSWIGIWARDFDSAWPMVYELLRLVEQEELYRDPRRVGPGAPGGHHGERTYSSFAEYFTDRVRQPFQRWAELEGTYQYAKTYAPELFEVAFPEAATAVTKAQQLAQLVVSPASPASLKLAARGEIGRGRNRGSDATSIGRGVEYLVARLKRDHPDIVERLAAGEFKSARAAAKAAGIKVEATPLQLLRRTWKRASPAERAAFRDEIE